MAQDHGQIHFSWHKLLVGLFLRCPNCEKGRMFKRLFEIEPICEVCGVRFERAEGESIGGMAINLGLAEVFSVGGFFIADAAFHPPFWPHMFFWIAFNSIFVVVFHRHARAMWVAFNYLNGGVYADPEPENPPPH